MRLLYHCGRFRNHGYTTFFGGGEPIELARAAADRLLQAVEKGQALPGSTGVLRRLTAEGREICEVVLFDHGRAPTQSQDAAIQLALDRLLEGDLAVALKSAVSAESFSAGQKLIGDALDKALPALAHIIGEAPVVAAVKRSWASAQLTMFQNALT